MRVEHTSGRILVAQLNLTVALESDAVEFAFEFRLRRLEGSLLSSASTTSANA
jgi:hypothetical protein